MLKHKKIADLFFALCVGYPLYALSFLFPRQQRRWVFGSGNSFADNAKYMFLDIIENHSDIDAVWISKNKHVIEWLRQKGLPAYHVYSLQGIKYLMTANVYVLSHYPNWALPLWGMGGAQHVQLWHGVGIKKLVYQRADPIALKRYHHPFFRYIYFPVNFPLLKKPHLYLATSPAMVAHFAECYRLPHTSLIESEYPRCQLFKLSQEAMNVHLRHYETGATIELVKKIQQYDKIFIYMPTWRQNKPNSIRDAGFDLKRLNDFLKSSNALFIFKLHFLSSKFSTDKMKDFDSIVFMDNDVDIYPVLPFTDILITDYSSIYYDYILMPEKHTIFFDYDRDEFADKRDFAFDYDEYTSGVNVKTFDELLSCLKNENYKHINQDKNQRMREFFWGNVADKKNLIQAIRNLEN